MQNLKDINALGTDLIQTLCQMAQSQYHVQIQQIFLSLNILV
jgi:hypothetical protein